MACAAVVGIALVWPFARRAVDLTATPDLPLEVRALESIRAIQKGERIYQSVHGYYDRLECVIQDSCATINPYPPTYLDASLAWPTRSGYRFRFHEGDRAKSGRDEILSPTGVTAFAMTAIPLDPHLHLPAYCGDDTNAVYQRTDGQPALIVGGRCAEDGPPLP